MEKQINLEAIHALADGNTDFIRDILGTFCQEAPAMLHQLNQKIATADLQGIAFYAHKLKSNLRLLGLQTAATLADEMEAKAKASEQYDFAAGLKDLQSQVNQAIDEVQRELATL